MLTSAYNESFREDTGALTTSSSILELTRNEVDEPYPSSILELTRNEVDAPYPSSILELTRNEVDEGHAYQLID